MQEGQIGRSIAGISAAGFVGTAALHATGYPSIAHSASQIQGIMGAAIPALWLAFSIDLLVLGLIVGAVALRPGGAGRVILGLVGLCPLGAAALQVHFIGFVAPTAILLAIGLMALVASAIGLGGHPRR